MSALDVLRNDIRQEFRTYVNNRIPIRIIQCDDVKNLKLVGRREVREYFQSYIDRLQLDDLERAGIFKQKDGVKDLVKKTVSYAILSHRWSDDEITFQDFGQERRQRSIGWIKVVRFCTEAARQGMRFAWVDTCCIDKTSSAELDESIRSMFKWYRNSTLCIIHLDQTTSLEDMARDQWFRRGWTLQELLAPERILFLSNRWDHLTPSPFLNDKHTASLSKSLDIASEVTGIPMDELRSFEPSPRKVDERMTWAANREVTREEDTAYSLMGLFDVSISTAYGEGLDRAFCRLVEAIMMAGGDASVLNWGGHPAKHHSTACMPASPASYQNHPERHAFNICRMDMALTSKGLRLPLVILPLDLVGFSNEEYSFAFTGGGSSRDIPKVTFTTTSLKDTGSGNNGTPPKNTSYAFGVTVYSSYTPISRKSEEEVVAIFPPLIGWLLDKISIWDFTFLMREDSADMSWRRLPTPPIHIPLTDDQPLMLKKSMLETIYL